MKKTIFVIATCIFSLQLIAGNIITSDERGDSYCTKMKEGKLIVMHGGTELTSDAMLVNGTVIKMDGTVIKKDGTKTVLKSGQCVNKEGKMESKAKPKAKPMEKTKTEKTK